MKSIFFIHVFFLIFALSSSSFVPGPGPITTTSTITTLTTAICSSADPGCRGNGYCYNSICYCYAGFSGIRCESGSYSGPSCAQNGDCSFTGSNYFDSSNGKCIYSVLNCIYTTSTTISTTSTTTLTTSTTTTGTTTTSTKTTTTTTITSVSMNASQAVIASAAAALTNFNSGTNSAAATKAITDILKTNKDISACLTNCSNNGLCTLDSAQNFVCSCFEFFTGKMCERDLRPCSSFPCLKNGTCNNIMNNTIYNFECKCKYPFYGRNCELKINLCQNVTCSKQGWCYLNDTIPYCKCFTGFLGDNCDKVTQNLAQAKMISDISGYLAITVIVLFFSIFIFMNLSKLCMKAGNETKRRKLIRPIEKTDEEKLKYRKSIKI